LYIVITVNADTNNSRHTDDINNFFKIFFLGIGAEDPWLRLCKLLLFCVIVLCYILIALLAVGVLSCWSTNLHYLQLRCSRTCYLLHVVVIWLYFSRSSLILSAFIRPSELNVGWILLKSQISGQV